MGRHGGFVRRRVLEETGHKRSLIQSLRGGAHLILTLTLTLTLILG